LPSKLREHLRRVRLLEVRGGRRFGRCRGGAGVENHERRSAESRAVAPAAPLGARERSVAGKMNLRVDL
jgi:hypothetical protein